MRKGDLYLWSHISTFFFFFSDSLCVVFAEINLPTVYFHDTPNFVF